MSRSIIIPAIAADGSYYPVDKMAAHEEGLLHLAVSVFVFDGDMLLIRSGLRGNTIAAGCGRIPAARIRTGGRRWKPAPAAGSARSSASRCR